MPHMDAAYNYARYLTRDPIAAEDVAQEALLRAFRAIAGFRGDAGKAWLLAIVRNCHFDRVGADRRQCLLESVRDENHAMPSLPNPEMALLDQCDIARVRSAVANLPDPFREPLVLRELEELSYRDIAGLTGVPIGTVMSRLARARHMLAKLLDDGSNSESDTR